MENTIDRYTMITVDGKEYKLQYTIRAIINLEKQLGNHSILDTLANIPFDFGDTFVFLKYGLQGGGHKLSDAQVEDIMYGLFETLNFGELQALIIETLTKSGAIGRVDSPKANKKK